MPNPVAEALRSRQKPKAPATPRPEILRALADPEFYSRDLLGHGVNAAKGVAAGVMGAPVDLATMAMRLFGFGVPDQDVYGSSEYIGQRLGADTNRASYIAGLIGAPDAMDAGKIAGIVGDYGPLLAAAPSMKKASKTRLYHGSPEVTRPNVVVGEGGMSGDNVFDGIFAADSRNIAASHGDNVFPYDVRAIATTEDLSGRADEVVDALSREVSGTKEQLEELADFIISENDDVGELAEILRPRSITGDIGWELQRLRGRVASELGYDAVEMADEHGTSYLIVK